MIWKSIALNKIRNRTHDQLDRLTGLVLTKKDTKAVETMEIKALIVLKSTYLLIKWPQSILQLKFSQLRPNFCN